MFVFKGKNSCLFKLMIRDRNEINKEFTEVKEMLTCVFVMWVEYIKPNSALLEKYLKYVTVKYYVYLQVIAASGIT